MNAQRLQGEIRTAAKEQHDAAKFRSNEHRKPTVDEEALARFQRQFEQFEQGEQESSDQGNEAAHLLQGGYLSPLHEPRYQPGMTNAAMPTSPTEELADLVAKLVDQMYVKRSETPGLQEVRMDLKSPQLPDTTLSIAKVDGVLTVQFATAAAASYQQLHQSRASLLQSLQRRYGQDGVKVKVDIVHGRDTDSMANASAQSAESIGRLL
ncbi:flagellar hook-length control protein FliK [Hahella aquimaris]|uniref:type III secretion HpaP family protein n=1 Tax=Hahella sp. HNIBRBA332 TaxID=3015983 RepID=UPI00273BBEA9|nr:type III secretion HpaP family protein [Hahella sp. HNIBRBA332]WLQ16256.1 flagellar hook-length control protein FliK [Hahella sp. HNIBRBA332]